MRLISTFVIGVSYLTFNYGKYCEDASQRRHSRCVFILVICIIYDMRTSGVPRISFFKTQIIHLPGLELVALVVLSLSCTMHSNCLGVNPFIPRFIPTLVRP